MRHQTNLDLKIFFGYISLQLAVGGWILTKSNIIDSLQARLGMAIIDIALAALTALILHRNSIRRTEVVKIVRRLNEALGFRENDVYVKNGPLHDEVTLVLWFKYYRIGIIVGLIGVLLVLFKF